MVFLLGAFRGKSQYVMIDWPGLRQVSFIFGGSFRRGVQVGLYVCCPTHENAHHMGATRQEPIPQECYETR
jgi:hypothetical protein